MRRLKRNAFAFAVTFVLSLVVSSLYPPLRDFVSWHIQYQLCQAAAEGKTSRVKALLLLGGNPNGFNTTYTPLHFAARYGQEDTARILLDAGADVNETGFWHQTPLMETIYVQDLETAKLLLARGGSVTSLDAYGRSAVWHASRQRNPLLVHLLMTHGGKNCDDARDALSLAVGQGDAETIRVLVNGGVDPRDVTEVRQLMQRLKIPMTNLQPEIEKILNAQAQTDYASK
jgi:ankyrin repeat protein